MKPYEYPRNSSGTARRFTRKMKAHSLPALMAGVLALTACANGSGGSDPEGDSIVLRYVTSETSAQPTAQAMPTFKTCVENGSDGGVEVELYDSNALGSVSEIVQGVRSGSVDIVSAGLPWWTSVNPDAVVPAIPFLFDDADDAREQLDGELGDVLRRSFEDAGLHVNSFMDNGFKQIMSSGVALRTIEDFDGLKIRIENAPIYIAAFDRIGADAVALDWGEVYTSVSTGVVDAVDNPLSSLLTIDLQEVSDYVLRSNHIYLSNAVVMNLDKWNSLDDETQQLVMDCHESEWQEQSRIRQEVEGQAEEAMTEAGIEFMELDPQDSAEMRVAMLSAIDTLEDELSPEAWAILTELAEVQN